MTMAKPDTAKAEDGSGLLATRTGRVELPERVVERPDPSLWDPEEIMSLGEAAALFFPRGPIREASLRTARRDGQLAVGRIAGKLVTTKSAVLAMIGQAMRAPAEVRTRPPRADAETGSSAPDPRAELRAKIEALVKQAG